MIGEVEKIEGNYTYVKINRNEMCGDCHQCDMMGERKPCIIKCLTKPSVNVGDVVEVDGREHYFLKATFTMYGFPLLALLIGLGIGALMPISGVFKEVMTLVLGIGLMTLSFLWIRYREKAKKYEHMLPRIIKRYE